MELREELKVAYTLLPPPLSALPAKYWTSISLLVHSYTVGRLFEELVRLYSNKKGNTPINSNEAFLIGFVHDFGQKAWLTKKQLEHVKYYIKEKVNELGYDGGFISKFIVTNAAESMVDPAIADLEPMLRFSDIIQGTNDLGDIVVALKYMDKEMGLGLNYNYYSILVPHPLVRAKISQSIERSLSNENTVLISTWNGLLAISTEPLNPVKLDWDTDFRLLDDAPLVGDSEKLQRQIKSCQEIGEAKKRYEEDVKKGKVKRKRGGWKKYLPEIIDAKHCEKNADDLKRLSTYEVVMLYFGDKKYASTLPSKVILPLEFKDKVVNIEIKGVEFKVGSKECPLCGAHHPQGMNLSFVSDLYNYKIKGVVTAPKEKWIRRYPPENINRLLANDPKYHVCPLCLMEALLHRHIFTGESVGLPVYFSLSILTPIPVKVLKELAGLFTGLVEDYGSQLIKPEIPWENIITPDIINNVYSETLTLAYDLFSSTMYAFHIATGRKSIEYTVNVLSLSGLLATWGFYPLKASLSPSTTPSENLLTFYGGQKLMFNYAPMYDRDLKVTPYVSSLLMSLGTLYSRKFDKHENLPATLELLNFEPIFAPLFLLYSSPSLYSILEKLRMNVEGVDVHE